MSKNIRNMSKEELINEYQKMSDLILQQSQKLNTLTETILLKDQTIVDLKTKIDNIEKLNNQLLTGEDIKKVILREYAREKSLLSIFHELSKVNSNVTLEVIKDKITNIHKLPNDLLQYFKEESSFYQKNKNLFSEDFKKNMLENELEDVSMKISMLLDKFISQKDLDDENSKVLFKLLDKYGMVTKQRIEITKQMEFKNLYTSQIENKGSTQVQNIFTNIGNIFNISELDTPTSIIGIAEEVEKYGK